MKIPRWRCGNNSNDGNNLQKPWHSPKVACSHPLLFQPGCTFWPLFAYLPPHSYLSSFIPTSLCLLHRMRFPFQTIAYLPHRLFFFSFFGTISYSTFNDLLQSFLIFLSVLVLLSHNSHGFWPLSFSFPFRLTLRCHLDPQSTLASPESFPPANALFSFPYRRLPSLFMYSLLSQWIFPVAGRSDDQMCTWKQNSKSCIIQAIDGSATSSTESHRNVADHQLYAPIADPFRLEFDQGFRRS